MTITTSFGSVEQTRRIVDEATATTPITLTKFQQLRIDAHTWLYAHTTPDGRKLNGFLLVLLLVSTVALAFALAHDTYLAAEQAAVLNSKAPGVLEWTYHTDGTVTVEGSTMIASAVE